MMPGGISPRIQPSFHSSPGQQVGIGYQQIHRLDAGVQIVFYGIEITIVTVRNYWRDITLRYPLHIVGCHIKRPDNRIQHLIYSQQTLLFKPTGLSHIRANIQTPCLYRLNQQVDFLLQFPCSSFGQNSAHILFLDTALSNYFFFVFLF